ncbi:MAG: hypothetical protein KBB55_01590 [Candidatus Buchananbacteria bacterium]|nr:hypothetical protein [Candidatus Buchananbacteria bacterium]
MTTKFIGVKEFRQNMAKITARSQKNNERLIVLSRNTPIFEVRPIAKKDFTLESLKDRIDQGLADKKAGRVYTQAQVEKLFGL